MTAADYQGALVFVHDTANQPWIDGDHYDKVRLRSKLTTILPDDYGQLQIVHPIASSTCEIIAETQSPPSDQLPRIKQRASALYWYGVRYGLFHESTTSRTLKSRLGLHNMTSSFEISDRLGGLSFEEANSKAISLETMSINEAGVACDH